MGGGVDTVINETCKRLRGKYDLSVFTTAVNFEPISDVNVCLLKDLAGSKYERQIFWTVLYTFLHPDAFSGYDLLWIHSLPLLIPALRVKRKLGIPILYSFHGIRTVRDSRLLSYRVLVRLSFSKIDLVVGVSVYVTLEARRYGAHAIRIYNGCDTEKFSPRFEDEGYMLTVGELAPHKAVNIPIEVSRNLGIPLKIVGDGAERDRLERYVRKTGANVEFHGLIPESELIKLYQKCSFFISGSLHEAFGLALLEACASGKPVIARNCTAIPEVVKHNKTGFLCNNDEEFIFYSKLLWENEVLRKTLGKNARKLSEKFSWNETANRYEKAINSLLVRYHEC